MGYFLNLFHLNNSEHQETDKYLKFCKKKRKLGPNYEEKFKADIFPILQNCYGKSSIPYFHIFCDSVYTAYFEYTYNNDINNKIGKCGSEIPKKLYDFCYEWYNSFRGWDEYAAYMFYMLFQHIFEYMDNSISGNSPLKMVMIGGHDVTVDKFMNFLDGMKIIPRTHYPHYACNIVIELRKYNNDFYLEFYYNDILKYNNTLLNFNNLLDNSKYNNLYNYCGLPPWIATIVNETKNETIESENVENKEIKNDTTNNETNKNETFKNDDTQNEIIKNEEIKNEIKNETNINETITDELQINNIIQNETQTTINNEEILNINKTIQNDTNKELENNDFRTNDTDINDEKQLLNNSSINGTLISLKTKLKQFFNQKEDLDLYIILFCIIFSIIIIIIFIIIIICIIKKRKKEFTKLMEEKKKNNSISAIDLKKE